MKDKRIVCIGGGTGSLVVLSGLKEYTNPSAIVSMADSGGSAKKERDEWGLLPVSDVRKALLALAEVDDERSRVLRELFNYRFANGVGLSGMTFGNLLLVALTNVLNSQSDAIQEASRLLNIKGDIYPVTYEQTNLVVTYSDGTEIVGEHVLDQFLERYPEKENVRVENFYLLPSAEANPRALEVIESADLIVFPPGDLYGSILANLAVGGIPEAVCRSGAKKIYIMNLVTKFGQTNSFKASGHVMELEECLGCSLDYILVNDAPMPKGVLERYREEKSFPVVDNLGEDRRVIRGDFLAEELPRKQEGDKLKRSFVRHDPAKLAKTLSDLGSS
ncbi:MAG: gluconeogenesis factor YvcK family protein [Patescibacteria group bacterium]|nr:gluconeogenesis factor YvcK family protein [Patescibacteria group bacterium]